MIWENTDLRRRGNRASRPFRRAYLSNRWEGEAERSREHVGSDRNLLSCTSPAMGGVAMRWTDAF